MSTSTAREARELHALLALLAPLRVPERLGCDELLHAVTSVGDLQSVLDAAKVRIAGELVRRMTEPDDANPVRRSGHTNPSALLADRWRIALPAARQLCRVGSSTCARLSLLGESLPARYPDLAEALAVASASGERDGDGVARSVLSVDQVAMIVRELDKATANCSLDAVAQGERLLVEHAQGLTVEDVRILAAQVRDRLDQDGILPREERQRRRRSLTISTTADGMTHVDWYLDPESAGYVVTAIDAMVGRQLRKVAFRDVVLDGAAGDGAGAGAGAGVEGDDRADRAMPESRSLPQIRSDSATEVFRHLAACTAAAENGTPPVSVIVRIELDALQKGLGTAQIDGIPTPISAATARRMAADAHLIPVVLGEASEVLDLGRSRRLFSRAQRLALAERDGGCAWAGCPHPPSYTEAHHIRWWTAHGGATDLDNGILLCSSHHHRVHADGWNIEIRDHVPWFIPPPSVDPYRRPRRGGRIVYPAERGVPVSCAS